MSPVGARWWDRRRPLPHHHHAYTSLFIADELVMYDRTPPARRIPGLLSGQSVYRVRLGSETGPRYWVRPSFTTGNDSGGY